MALVKCPECGKENVSSLAKSCPSCGYGLKVHFKRESAQDKGEGSANEKNHYNDFKIRGGVLLEYKGNDKTVIIPDAVVGIGEGAFKDCRNLEQVVLPPTITEIGSSAFSNCNSLREVTLPDSVEEIGSGAFGGCTSLETVNIPKSVKKIGAGAFKKCPSLTNVLLTVKKFESSHYGLRDIFEELSEHSSLDMDEYLDEQCGPWYLNYKKKEKKRKEALLEKQQEWRANYRCQHCGGEFEGVIENICSKCGKPKDYGSGCYVATFVYGSYDCPEVWTLRRFRDNVLAETWYGRAFVRTYYDISPTLVKWFGRTRWFKNICKPVLDCMVKALNEKGVDNTRYDDRAW